MCKCVHETNCTKLRLATFNIITTSPHHHIITSPHHYITTSPHHHITTSPHHHPTRLTTVPQPLTLSVLQTMRSSASSFYSFPYGPPVATYVFFLAFPSTACPTSYRTRHFSNNFTTNEVIATKFEADCRHIPLHFSHNERTPVQISLQYLHLY